MINTDMDIHSTISYTIYWDSASAVSSAVDSTIRGVHSAVYSAIRRGMGIYE